MRRDVTLTVHQTAPYEGSLILRVQVPEHKVSTQNHTTIPVYDMETLPYIWLPWTPHSWDQGIPAGTGRRAPFEGSSGSLGLI